MLTPADFHLRRSGIGWKLCSNQRRISGGYRPWHWDCDTDSLRDWFFTQRGALRKLRRVLNNSQQVHAITRDGNVNRIPVTDLRAL